MDTKLKKCKTCGRPFTPKVANDNYCSAVCRATGCFVSGGGDQTKPMNKESKKAVDKNGVSSSSKKQERTKKIRGGAQKFPRVHQMFSLPMSERWRLAKDFTKEEAEYARRLARKMLQDEWRMDNIIDWDGEDEELQSLGSYAGIVGGRLGDSDDGTI